MYTFFSFYRQRYKVTKFLHDTQARSPGPEAGGAGGARESPRGPCGTGHGVF